MNTRRLTARLALPLLAALVPVACSSAPDERAASSDVSELSTGIWTYLELPSVYQIAAARGPDGRVFAFGINGSGAVIVAAQKGANGDWGNEGSLGGSGIKQIAVGHNADGRLEVFGVGGNGALFHDWMTDGSGNNWGGWQSLGGSQIQQVAVGNEADGRLRAFVIGGDANVYSVAQSGPNGGWGSFVGQGGGPLVQIATGTDPNGALEVLGIGRDGALWDSGEIRANGPFAPWTSLGGWGLQQLAVGENADGRIEAYVRGGDGVIYHQWRTPAGSWSGWASLGGSALRDLAVGREADGRVDVFVVGGDGAIYQQTQNAPSGGWSGGWSLRGEGPFLHVAAASDLDGREELIGLETSSHNMKATHQTAPNGDWVAPPPPPPPCTPGGQGWLQIDEFATYWDNTSAVLGDVEYFQIAASHVGGAVSLSSTIDGIPFKRYVDGTKGLMSLSGAPRWSASSPLHHSLSITGECGTVTRTLDVSLVAPTVPAFSIAASTTYVNAGDPVTISYNAKSFAFPNCMEWTASVLGIEAGTNKQVFLAEGITGSVVVHPTSTTYYSVTGTCAHASPQAGTPRTQTSPQVLVTIAPQQQPPPTWYCFTITTPTTASMPGSCWAEAIPASDESTAEAIEKNRNGGNATVESLGACTSVPTNACPDPFGG